jgi:hypothetical protein
VTDVLIPLCRRDGSIRAHAIIDAGDARFAEHRWSLNGNGYAHRGAPGGFVLLHRVILGLVPGDGLEGDHVNGDTLDCRRSNLRIASHAENGQNVPAIGGASSHRGVSWESQTGRWRAIVQLNGKKVRLGRFDDEDAAASAVRAYRLAHMPFTNEARAIGGGARDGRSPR